MRVYVKLYASLAKFAGCRIMHEPMEVELPDKASLGELFDRIGIPPQEVKTAFVNSVIQDPNYTLSDGDDVGIFPPVGGGAGVGSTPDRCAGSRPISKKEKEEADADTPNRNGRRRALDHPVQG